jgi:tetratricopeptide (TPR) repeat protein
MKKAVAIDSTYAEAHVGLALSVVQRKLMAVEVPRAIVSEAELAIKKALDLNPSLARAYGALGNLSYIAGKLPECFDAWEKAFEMDSSDGFIVSTYSWILMIKGNYDEGVRLGEKAVALDPLAQYVRCNLMGWYYTMHRFKEAEAQASKILEIDSTWEPALNNLALLCEHEGRYDEARRWWLKDFQRLGIDTKSFPRTGSWQEFRSWRTKAYERAGYLDASVFSLLFEGDKERAIATLKKCVERNSWIAMALFYPDFDPLRGDPRFAEIIAKAQLPVEAYCELPKKK